MDKAEYYRTIHKLVEDGYGWDAIKDITKMMETAWDNHEAVIREAVWERNTIRRMVKSDKSNKAKIDAIKDVLGGDSE